MVTFICPSDKSYSPLAALSVICANSQCNNENIKVANPVIQASNYLDKLRCISCLKFGRGMFIDADYFFRKSWSLKNYMYGNAIVAVRDPGVVFDLVPLKNDAELLGFPADTYCNTGFFSWNAENPKHRRAFTL
jgi:hypothetical protein